jgi:methylenetetrahydrofolate dehydrogenase (NADP+) / methenyltetrahydrofolate cyclohydrolase
MNTAQILDGNRVAGEIKNEVAARVAELAARKRRPGLAAVLVGDNPASQIYVRNKVKTCEALGIYSAMYTPSENATTGELLDLVAKLNAEEEIDGILIQLPLPKQIDAQKVLLAVAPEKDVDGLHPLNIGNLVSLRPGPRPCTPAGILELLKRYQVPIAGSHAVVVGRSDLVGKPVAFLLLHQHATVTICHSKTPDLPVVCSRAEILVAAMGKPAMLMADYIRPGAVVVDVGTNRIDDRAQAARIFRDDAERLSAFDRKGNVLVGDVDPIDVVQRASYYTPVPGGVGPLTIAMLMVNVTESAERRLGHTG